MASPHCNLNQTFTDDDEKVELFSDDLLLSCSERYLNIVRRRMLQQRERTQDQTKSGRVEQLAEKIKVLAIARGILAQLVELESSGHLRGFVYGLIGHDSCYTGASDNLRPWWKDVINFEKNGPRILKNPVPQTLSLRSLQDLQDTSLSSLVSTLMTECTPSQRLFPFEAGIPVEWWPRGTEEWWAELGLPENLKPPPPYRKPHDLKKVWKVAVAAAIIKNIRPNFKLMRDVVAQGQPLQSKMSSRENEIWLAVLRGEELAMRCKLRSLSASRSSGGGGGGGGTSTPVVVLGPEPQMAPANSTDSVLAPQGPTEEDNADGVSGRQPEMATVSNNQVLAEGLVVDITTACDVESNGTSNRKMASGSEPDALVPLSASPAIARGRADQMSEADEESNRRKRTATSEPAITQGQIETKAAAGVESSSRRQKLKGIASVDEPVGQLLPSDSHQENFHTSPASARNFEHPSSNHQPSAIPTAGAGTQRPNVLPGNFHSVLVDSEPHQIQDLAREDTHAGMANAGAANNNPFAPPGSTLSVSYLWCLNNNNGQPTMPMSIPAFSMPTPRPAEYYGVPSSLGSHNNGQVNSSNWASSVVPDEQAPLARSLPNCLYSPGHGVPVSISQTNQPVQAENSTLSAAAEINTPNESVSIQQNQHQQARPMSTTEGGELISNKNHQQSARHETPQAESNLMSTNAAGDDIGTRPETGNAAAAADDGDDPLEQLKSLMTDDRMMNLESVFDGFDADGYMRKIAYGEINQLWLERKNS